jgi:hypothetical protein
MLASRESSYFPSGSPILSAVMIPGGTGMVITGKSRK